MVRQRFSLKRVLLVFIMALFIWTSPGEVMAAEEVRTTVFITGENENENLPPLEGWEQVEKYWYELEEEMGEFLPSWNIRDIWKNEGRGIVPFRELCTGLGRYLFAEVITNLGLLGQLLFLAVAAALLKSLQGAFSHEEVARLTEAVAFFVLLGLAMKSFTIVVETGKNTLEGMVNFMLALLPVLFTLMASLGHIASVSLFHPLIIFAVNFTASLISNIIFPLIFFATILYLMNHFSPHFKINRLADLFRDISIFGLGLLLTLFIGFMAIQGVAGGIGDALTLKTAKFMTGTFIPVVGGMLADAVETVLGYSLLIKNSATIVGLVILALITVFPLLKILAVISIYKICSALIQPLGETTLGEALQTMSKCLTLIFAAVATVALAFFIGIAIIIGASNATVMLR
ncbi:MAG: stage III sporulation protein AE [Dethiobacteria bacterium]|jgi:stage III sporulation protein AE